MLVCSKQFAIQQREQQKSSCRLDRMISGKTLVFVRYRFLFKCKAKFDDLLLLLCRKPINYSNELKSFSHCQCAMNINAMLSILQ